MGCPAQLIARRVLCCLLTGELTGTSWADAEQKNGYHNQVASHGFLPINDFRHSLHRQKDSDGSRQHRIWGDCKFVASVPLPPARAQTRPEGATRTSDRHLFDVCHGIVRRCEGTCLSRLVSNRMRADNDAQHAVMLYPA